MMTLTIDTQPVPLMLDQDGVIRVGGTRVTLDTIVYAFQEGATAEEIVQRYPSLALSDVYAVLGYYLRHIVEIHAYLQQREAIAREIRAQNEHRFDPNGIRERLLRRQPARKLL
jgi:uncharacterized protein (DUF433 family)